MIVFILLVPQGSHVYVLAEVKDETVLIDQCALKKGYLMSVILPEETISHGNRNIILRVFYNQTELFTSDRCIRYNIGTGDCVLESNTLPSDLPIDSELLIQIELLDANNRLIAKVEDSLVYK